MITALQVEVERSIERWVRLQCDCISSMWEISHELSHYAKRNCIRIHSGDNNQIRPPDCTVYLRSSAILKTNLVCTCNYQEVCKIKPSLFHVSKWIYDILEGNFISWDACQWRHYQKILGLPGRQLTRKVEEFMKLNSQSLSSQLKISKIRVGFSWFPRPSLFAWQLLKSSVSIMSRD